MKFLLSAFLYAVLTFNLFATDSFWTIDEFFSLNGGSTQHFDNFIKVVKNDSIPLKTRNGEPVKISVVYPAYQTSDYWIRSVDAMEKRLIELNVNYILYKYYSKPSDSFRVQARQISDALDKKSDFIVVSIDNVKIRSLLDRVLISGKTKVIIQNNTTPLKRWENNQPLIYVGFDHIKGSKILAEYFADKFSSGTKYAVLYGTKGIVSELRGDGFVDSLNNISKMSAVEYYYTDIDEVKSESSVYDLLSKHKDISFIFACTTSTALGASNALKKLNLKNKIFINGWGGTQKELESIKKKFLDVTVMRMNDDNGVAVAEAVKFSIEGRASEVPPVFSGEFKVVTTSSTDEEVNKYKNRAFRYSGIE